MLAFLKRLDFKQTKKYPSKSGFSRKKVTLNDLWSHTLSNEKKIFIIIDFFYENQVANECAKDDFVKILQRCKDGAKVFLWDVEELTFLKRNLDFFILK